MLHYLPQSINKINSNYVAVSIFYVQNSLYFDINKTYVFYTNLTTYD